MNTQTYRDSHKEQTRIYNKAYRESHRQYFRVKGREWYAQAGPEKRDAARRFAARNREIIAAAKDVPCTDCGVRYSRWVMQFDHLPQYEKSFDLSKAPWRRTEVVLAEIEKCEVVCANCHSERTHVRAGG